MRGRGWIGWAVAALLAGALFWTLGPGRNAGGSNVERMLREGSIEASVSASDASSAQITLRLASGTARGATIVIPAGTVLSDATPGRQRLVTARAVTVVLSPQNPEQTVTISTYCLDQFRTPPTSGDVLSIAADAGQGSTGEETNPVRKLADCLSHLEPSGGAVPSHAQSQYAIWAVAGGFLSLSSGEARIRIRDHYLDALRAQSDEMLRGPVRDALARAMPGMTPDQLDAAVSAYGANRLPAKLSAKADSMTAADLRMFGDPVLRQALDRCGYPTVQQALFAG